jgi:hypothetical protein
LPKAEWIIEMINSTPKSAPFPVEEFFKLSKRELALRSWHWSGVAQVSPCSKPVRIGLFFDGTNNNMYRDKMGERIAIGGMVMGGGKTLSASERYHSNIARLFQVYAQTNIETGNFSYYLPGVGTRFLEVGELTETSEGKAFAKGGEARIVYALLQVINSVYGAIVNRPLYTDKQIGAIAQGYEHPNDGTKGIADSFEIAGAHKDFFEKHLSALQQAITSHAKPAIPSITLDVFGFSRGSAQAVAFCHMFNEILSGGRLVSVPASVNFLGLFDTVATVGVSASVGKTTVLPAYLADGHFSWAKKILKPLPSIVRSGRHYIAAHEQRMNFPVTTQTGSNDFKEFYFPGVHSDVGGGYGPGEGGKGRSGQSAMLSQIPLAYMYRDACLEGVPFLPYEDFEESVKEDFAVSSEVAVAWEAYCEALNIESKEFGNHLRKSMALYYYWRAARLDSLEQTDFFKLASKQSQQDMTESNQSLKGDLGFMKQRLLSRLPDDPLPTATVSEAKTINQWHIIYANDVPTSWEKWASSCFSKPKKLSQHVLKFFDDYVHDSMAGFYLAGECTEYDRRLKTDLVKKTKPEKRNRFEKKIFDMANEADQALKKKHRGEKLSTAEASLANEAENGTPFPLMTDADIVEIRNPAIRTQTSSRREGGGYLLKRGFYPRDEDGL